MNFNMQKLMNFNTIVDDTNGARFFQDFFSTFLECTREKNFTTANTFVVPLTFMLHHQRKNA